MALNKIKVNDTTTVNTGVVYDITKATGQKYDTLSAALGTGGNNVPPEVREGGMSIRFVLNSDNKYVQARLMADSFTTDVTQWQLDVIPTDFDGTDLDLSDNQDNVIARFSDGHIKTKNFDSKDITEKCEILNEIDEKPLIGSKNLVTSDGVAGYVSLEKKEHSANVKVGDNTPVEVPLHELTPYTENSTIDLNLSDLDLSDNQDNVIARFSDGHIKTKNFDSKDITEKCEILNEIDEKPLIGSKNLVTSDGVAGYVSLEKKEHSANVKVGDNTPVEVPLHELTPYTEDSITDLNLSDGQGNVIVKFAEGNLETKNFKSENAIIKKEIANEGLEFADKQGNVGFILQGGNINTPNFHSLDSIGKDEYIRNRDLNHFAIKDRAMKEWSELQFGLFLHWGVFATGYVEPGDIKYKVPGYTLDSYREYIKSYENQFTSTDWNTDRICQMAKSVGMKYIILTVRHQEGFCLYPSPYANWTVKTSGADEDIVMKLKKSCDKFGLKFGFYIQIMFDIMEEGCYDLGTSEFNNNGWFPSDPYTKEQHEKYMKKQMMLLKDLCENIKPYCIFFDGSYSAVPKWYNDIDIISNFVDANIPYVITNNRDGGSIYYIHDKGQREIVRGDYWSQEMSPDDKLPFRQNQERCAVLTHSWWYYPDYDENIANLRTLPDMLWDIFKTIERGFNYTIDYGPRPDGGIPTPVVTWFGYLKDWCNKYLFFNNCKKTIYYSHQKWGRMALKDNSIYCLVCPSVSSQFYLDGVTTANLKGVHIYGIQSPDDSSNYEVVSEDRLLIKNVPLTSVDYYPIVRIDYYTEPSFMDYVYADENNGITGCAFSVSRNTVDWGFGFAQKDTTMRLYYGNSTIITRFKWNGEDTNYGITLDAVLTAQQVITVNVYSDDGTLLMSDNSLGKDSSDVDTLSTTEKINLVNGEIYQLEILRDSNNTNTVITNLKNITFE